MRRRLSLLLMLLLAYQLSSCAGGPQVKVCISDPPSGGFDCYDERTHVTSFLPYVDSDKYVAFDPSDAQTVLTYCENAK